MQAEEGASATLRCELSQPNAAVVWSKGGLELQADGRREPRQRGHTAELVLRDLRKEDTGEYTCACGPQATSAALTVTGGLQVNTCPRGKFPVLWAGPLGCSTSLGVLWGTRAPVGMAGMAGDSAPMTPTLGAEPLRLPPSPAAIPMQFPPTPL